VTLRRLAAALIFVVLLVLTFTRAAPPSRADSYGKGSDWCAAEASTGAFLEFWSTDILIDRYRFETIALTHDQTIALCQTGPLYNEYSSGQVRKVVSPRASPQPLTFDLIQREDPKVDTSPPSALVGRVPDGTTAVRVTLADGRTVDATVGKGLWLLWPEPGGTPVVIEALDAAGASLGLLADPNGLVSTR
jgi:hypothetical protein